MSIAAVLPSRDQGTLINIIQGSVIGVLLTALSYIVALKAGWVTEVNLLEVFAVFTSYVSTWLCVFERRANYPVGAISCFAYTILFYSFGLYGSAVVNAYLTIALVYGWFRWRADADTRPITHLQWKWIPVYLAVTAAFYFVALWLVTAVGGTLAVTDTVVLVTMMLAQFLLDNKKFETWYVWAVVNVFAIYTYANAGLSLAAFQYVFFLINAFYGMYMWKKSMEAQLV
jgi:nicotinamide mononucleotide transporter